MESCVREIEVLIFSAVGIRLGVETSQVRGVLEPEQTAGTDLTVFDIPDQLKINSSPVVHKSPKVLLVNSGPLPIGIAVDLVEEIEAVGFDRIQPMPALIERCNGAKAIWGSVVKGDEVLLLIDFYKLPCCGASAG